MKKLVLLFLILNFYSLQAQDASWRDKAEPQLWERTADGRMAPFFIILAEQANLDGAYALRDKPAKGAFVFQALRARAEATQENLAALLKERGVEYRPYYLVNAIRVVGGRQILEAVARKPEVRKLIYDAPVQYPAPVDSRPDEGLEWRAAEWGVAKINADDVWALGYSGQGIIVGGQDTGYDWDHPALIGQYRGWNGSSASHDYN
ncbi:MAG: hypothetical protein KDC66_14895 [Phaeodactylibacter sp.]|nr:hypothetical protein [Phaeodactylibacter sp.]MCB9273773.1 hypothetical protein [Lewinellaceae bacterium]